MSGIRSCAERNIDTLVKCAGHSQGSPLEEIPVDRVPRQFEANAFGASRFMQRVLPGVAAYEFFLQNEKPRMEVRTFSWTVLVTQCPD